MAVGFFDILGLSIPWARFGKKASSVVPDPTRISKSKAVLPVTASAHSRAVVATTCTRPVTASKGMSE